MPTAPAIGAMIASCRLLSIRRDALRQIDHVPQTHARQCVAQPQLIVASVRGLTRLARRPRNSYAPQRVAPPRQRPRTSDLIVVIDSSEIHEGKLEALKHSFEELVEFVEATEDRPILYGVYFDDGGTHVTVAQIHPSSESLEFHMKVAAPVFRGFADLLELSRVDVYGTPSNAVLEQIRDKAQLLGGAPVVVHELHARFARLPQG
jgi:hypothetical protein